MNFPSFVNFTRGDLGPPLDRLSQIFRADFPAGANAEHVGRRYFPQGGIRSAEREVAAQTARE